MKDFALVAFDTETIGLGGDVIFWSWCDAFRSGGEPVGNAKKGQKDFTQAFIDRMLCPAYDRHIIIAHAGLRFDVLRLDFARLAAEGFKAKIFSAKNHNNIRGMDFSRGKFKWFIRDSLCYTAPGITKLKVFAETFAPEHKKMDFDFTKRTFNPNNKEDVQYAIQDSIALYHSCKNFDDLIRKHFDVSMMDAITLPGVSYKALKKISKLKGYPDMPYIPTYFEKAIRSSYHGGFTAAFKVGKFKGLVYYDINSAYQDAMEKYPMPSGMPIVTTSKPDGIKLIFCSVDFADSFPYLVSKPDAKSCAGRYSGRVFGWWWDFEIQRQRELGAYITEHLYMSWPDTDDRQHWYIKLCKKLRMKDYNGPIGMLGKLFGNGCYGKHGSEKHDVSVVLSEERPSPEAFPYLMEDGEPVPSLWEVPNGTSENFRCMVHWASYITARVRWQLMGYLMRVPQKDWYYCDTDSFIVPRKYKKLFAADVGPDYGQLKIEGELSHFEIRAPKTYRGITTKRDKEGKLIRKDAAKGIPKAGINAAWKNGKLSFDGSISLGYIIKGKLLNRELKSYTRRTQRCLSSPLSVRCGSYVKGVWTPKPYYASFRAGDSFVDIPIPLAIKLQELHP